MNITVAGLGYVGLSLAVLLAQNNKVIGFDINDERLKILRSNKSPFVDKEIDEYLLNQNLSIEFTNNPISAFQKTEILIIATPTNFDSKRNYFDTTSIEMVIKLFLSINQKSLIVIKSTIPIGYTLELREKFNYSNIVFSPEFLREGKALFDNLYPSRIIVGDNSLQANEFGMILKNSSLNKDVKVLYVKSNEAEAIKLFSNAYLAMRVAFFNELDTYAEKKKIDSKEIINGISLDPRIGNYYNNPSFGYGGYCLPKDSKQLLSSFKDVPQNLMKAIVDSNRTRKNYIANVIIRKKPKVVGIFRLVMKSGSDNFRYSAIIGIMKRISSQGIEVIIYEPEINDDYYLGAKVFKNLETFKIKSNLILCNRMYKDLEDVVFKVYTRDLFTKD